ncbi:MAG: nucleoside-diphosphate sugar epimerase/dehydratase [Syntrophobacter sp.]
MNTNNEYSIPSFARGFFLSAKSILAGMMKRVGSFTELFMLQHLENPRFYAMILTDAIVFITAFVMAYCLRFEFLLTKVHWNQIKEVLPFLLASKLVVFYFFKLYKGMWRYSSLSDFWRLAQASFVSMLLCVAFVLYSRSFIGFSRAVFLMDALLTFLFSGAFRVAIRTYYSARTYKRENHDISVSLPEGRSDPSKRILIIGAGDSGEKILREIIENPHLRFCVIGFLDDDPAKRGRAIHGVPVLGCVEKLPDVVERHRIEQVFISAPSATGAQMRRIVEVCKGCDVSYKTLPAIGQIMDGKVSIKALRDVNYEDLLRRPPVVLNTTGIQDYLSGRVVLVTGAGGSIGSELCRQLIRFGPEKLILLDAGETNLYDIQMELRHELNFDACRAVLARVQHQGIVDEVFKTYRPQVVFHAAAYKHVPMLERNPWEAVFNNVMGSRVVMEMSAKYVAERFVLVSTDKAVRPTSVMGTSKRLAELVLQSMRGGKTRFMAVRFGNVLASSGSVIPLFRKQIEHGGPVTVTHPEVTRYFMTIPEASQLILQAGAIGDGGEIFVLEMGTAVKISDLAMDLIRLSGKEPGKDVEIVFTGLRPGEKLYEELIIRGEDVAKTAHDKIMALHYNGHWNWNGMDSQDRFQKWLIPEINDLYRVAETHDACAIRRKLKELVHEYEPQDTECVF